MRKVTYTLLLASSFLFLQCKKDNTPIPVPPAEPKTNFDFLAGMDPNATKSWKLDKAMVGLVNITSLIIPACQADDIFRFRRDSTMEMDRNGTRCDSADRSVEYGPWHLLDNDKRLIMIRDSVPMELDIIEVNKTNFVGRTIISSNNVDLHFYAL